jgi:hypothetical protein
MTQLLKKEVKYDWAEACEKSFQKLKELFTTAPVLAVSDADREFEVYTDAFKNDLGCVLMQEDK